MRAGCTLLIGEDEVRRTINHATMRVGELGLRKHFTHRRLHFQNECDCRRIGSFGCMKDELQCEACSFLVHAFQLVPSGMYMQLVQLAMGV